MSSPVPREYPRLPHHFRDKPPVEPSLEWFGILRLGPPLVTGITDLQREGFSQDLPFLFSRETMRSTGTHAPAHFD